MYAKRTVLLPALLTLALAVGAFGADAPAVKKDDTGVKEDLAKIQGAFAHEVRDKAGKVVGRVVKYVRGEREMVVHERADGTVTHAHRADIEITRARGVRLFRFYNAEVIEGPRKGQKMGSGAYVYRIDDNAFTEAVGFFAGHEKQAPAMRVYTRVKDFSADDPPATEDPKE